MMEEGGEGGEGAGEKAAGGGDPHGWGGSRPRSAALGHLHPAAGPSGGPGANPSLRFSGSYSSGGFRRMCSDRSSVAIGLLMDVCVRRSGLGFL